MKIAYLCTDPDVPVCGKEACSIHLRAMVESLSRGGHDVSILSTAASRTDELGFRVYPVQAKSFDQRILNGIQEEQTLQDHGLVRDVQSLVRSLALVDPIFEILMRESPDVIYERYGLFGLTGICLSKRSGIPIILEVNAPLCQEQEGYEFFRLTNTAQAIEREVLRSADALVVVSTWLKDWAIKLGASADRVFVVPNGVFVEAFGDSKAEVSVRTQLGLDEKIVFGYVGSFQRWHDIAGLLQAFQELAQDRSDLRLLLAGYGPRYKDVLKQIRTLDLQSKVILTNQLTHDKIPELLQAMDISVLPYRGHQTSYFSPIKLFEAMAAGLAVVAASVGDLPKMITHKQNGWLYQAGDHASLLESLRVLASSPELRSRLGQAARETVRNQYTWGHAAQQVLQIAERLVNSSTVL